MSCYKTQVNGAMHARFVTTGAARDHWLFCLALDAGNSLFKLACHALATNGATGVRSVSDNHARLSCTSSSLCQSHTESAPGRAQMTQWRLTRNSPTTSFDGTTTNARSRSPLYLTRSHVLSRSICDEHCGNGNSCSC